MRPQPRQNIYRIAARLSIVTGIACTIAAAILPLLSPFIATPGNLADRMNIVALGVGITCAISFFISFVPAVIGWMDPASSRIAKAGMLWAFAPFPAAFLTGILVALISRLLI